MNPVIAASGFLQIKLWSPNKVIVEKQFVGMSEPRVLLLLLPPLLLCDGLFLQRGGGVMDYITVHVIQSRSGVGQETTQPGVEWRHRTRIRITTH